MGAEARRRDQTMAKTKKMNQDERDAVDFLQKHGLTATRFTPDEERAWSQTLQLPPGEEAKLPDFKVRPAWDALFYCEQKTLGPEAADNEGPQSFNAITRNIENAALQFQTVNASHMVPNVLIWTNYNGRRLPDDVQLAVQGALSMSNGERVGGFERLSQGRIRDLKHLIDLHIWIDKSGQFNAPNWRTLKNPERPEHFRLLCRCFNLDPDMPEDNA